MSHTMILSDEERIAVLRCRYNKYLGKLANAKKKIVQLNAVIFVPDRDFQEMCQKQISHYKSCAKTNEMVLARLRKDLGIETPTSNEGSL